MRVLARAKANLVLRVGRRREDGLHELASIFARLELADEVVVDRAAAGPARDEVVCPGVEGENLASAALAAFRASVPDARLPPLRATIGKRIPLSAGLGGGSADAAALLCAANELAGAPLAAVELRKLAASLGSDVPALVRTGHALVSGTGETAEAVELPPMTLVLVPQRRGLSTAAVYAELDRLRDEGAPAAAPGTIDVEPLRRLVRRPLPQLVAGLANDLEPAALALRPELNEVLAALRERGALGARLTGSGPTAFGVFGDLATAHAAAASLPDAIVTGLAP